MHLHALARNMHTIEAALMC